MKAKQILNEQTIKEAFKHLVKKEPLFESVLIEKNYELVFLIKRKVLKG